MQGPCTRNRLLPVRLVRAPMRARLPPRFGAHPPPTARAHSDGHTAAVESVDKWVMAALRTLQKTPGDLLLSTSLFLF